MLWGWPLIQFHIMFEKTKHQKKKKKLREITIFLQQILNGRLLLVVTNEKNDTLRLIICCEGIVKIL